MALQQPVENDFGIEVREHSVIVSFWPSRTVYVFSRFSAAKDIAEFGPLSPSPRIQHASATSGTRNFNSAEVLAIAGRLALAAVLRTP
jgi:hypothetical protein